MKPRYTITIISVVLGVTLVIGAGYLIFSRSTQAPSKSNTNFGASTVWVGDIVNGSVLFTVPYYGFSIALPSSFSYSIGSSNVQSRFSIGFSSPNQNTSEIPNRDTPNRINTSAYNSFGIQIFPNDSRLSGNDVKQFRAWRKPLYDDSSDSIQTTSIAGYPTFFAIQADGIDSRGLYYYIVQPNYIVMVSTGDFSDTQMVSFLSNFRVGNY